MKLYNTLTRTTQTFTPLQENLARIYSCGPTVYDHAHIGNLSAYIFADTLRRAIALEGFNVKHVMNYTDIDDKTIRRSREQFTDKEPREGLRILTDRYIELFRKDMRSIGNDIDAITFVRATDHIDGMKELIKKLHAAGFAYIADDGVYFSIEAYQASSKVYGQLLELTAQNTSEARIQNDEYDKDSAHDFALWKKRKDNEPAWEFIIDNYNLTGRPGWHIECSVMSRNEVGQPFDIHTGGVDLIFPHHENEIAQSTALEDNPMMAQFFVHNEHILVDGKKMAKSAKNFHTLQDIIDKGFDPLAFRLLVLQAHYRSQIHFSWENLQAAQNRLNEIRAWADLRHQASEDTITDELGALLQTTQRNLLSALAEDLNTPQALAILGKLITHMSHITSLPDMGRKYDEILDLVDKVFGLDLANRPDITADQKQLIIERNVVRTNKDWAKSDELRDQLKIQGLGVRDTANGTIWYRLK